ncbi:MAG: aromatic ring-hydroxylating dioxygenase subunit alpha [Rhizobiales bacterium TMED168]|nr:MAG: aromatic ring-hydroxylating dioxygenase subunit alpha [Rhizobiales bacterium TMED168]|tara:strand:+ start:1521 stop:2747 length:1227 start_codon:yes stop_codon:yes gene_type:complete
MDAKKIQEVRDQMEYERTRNSPPKDFPKLPEIPGKRYTDQNLFDLEMEKIFFKSWLMVFREDEIPNPGDYKVWDKLDRDILIVRQKDHSIKAFYNTCMHRGAPVVRDKKGSTNLLRCQYHSWTYDLGGDLVKVPDMRDFKDFDISCKKLKKVFCDTWDGWVYISLSDSDPGSLIDFLNPVAQELKCFKSSELITVYKKTVTVKANWKTCLDAFMEVYHAPTIHKDTVNILLDGNAMAAGLLKNGHSRMVTPKKMNLDGGFLGAEEADYVPYIETCDKIHAQTNVAYGMFPNFITPTDTSGYPAILFWPKGLKETEFEWTQLAPKWSGEEKPDYWNEQEISFDSIMDEDFQNLEPMQRSHDSGVFESMPLNYQERRIYYYHQVIDDWIGRENLPQNIQVPNVLDPFIEA